MQMHKQWISSGDLMTKNAKYFVQENGTVIDSMRAINEGGYQIAVIINGDGILCGVVTDGDIRRGLLRGIVMSESVSTVMNTNPTLATPNTDTESLRKLMHENGIRQIPIVDEMKKVLSVVTLEQLVNEKEERENSVILMVGGLGSRLGELTEKCPKPMLKVGDKPILEIILGNFKEQGFKNFFFSVNYRSEMIEEHFGDGSAFGVNIEYIRETERMGTVGSLSLFKPKNNLPVIVMNGDLLTQVSFSRLLAHHQKQSFDACMCVRQYDYQIPFGVVHVNGYVVSRVEEKPSASCLVSAGIYVLNPKLLEMIPHGAYLDMPTFFDQLISLQNKVGVFPVHEYWLDIGRKDDFYKAELEYFKRFK